MINEYQFNILLENNYFDINYLNNLFGFSKLKKYINKIYDITKFQTETFIISLYYINKIIIFIPKNKFNIILLVVIIIINKQLYDEIINVKKICSILFINFNEYLLTEIFILKLFKWDIYIDCYDCNDYLNFKKQYYFTNQQHQMD